jgi:hypothetical protein
MAGNLIIDIERPQTDFKMLFEILRKQKVDEIKKLNDDIEKEKKDKQKLGEKYDNLMILVMGFLTGKKDTDGLENFKKDFERIYYE